MNEHTKEPWTTDDSRPFTGRILQGGNYRGGFVTTVDRDRVIAEHNACLEIPTEALEAGAVKRLVELIDSGMYLDDDLQDAIAALKPEGE